VDTADFAGQTAVNANLVTGVATGLGTDSLVEIENLSGSDSHIGDTLVGNNKANVLDGRNGPDRLRGGAGADTLLGGKGDDILVAGGGCGGDGAADIVDGGLGTDTALDVLADPDTVIGVETINC
jgi:Ca2+-binding RTX toxin-like protein